MSENRWFSATVLLLFLAGILLLLPASSRAASSQATASIAQNESQAIEPAAPTACTVPTTATVRGKAVEFDQCYERTFSHDGTSYTIRTYYTEQDVQDNLDQCDPSNPDDYPGRCEHKISDNDDGNGDNVNAVALAAEVEDALRFYADRNIDAIAGTQFDIYIAEDPRGGGVISPSSMYADDELIDSNDVLWKRLLAFHEIMHLVQDKYDSQVGWRGFYGEGIARAIEDRVDTALDADTGHLFIPEANGILGNNGERTSDISTLSYRSVLWWTWLLDQYRDPGDTDPVIGWTALRDFYLELDTESDQLKAIRDFIASQGGNFDDDFIDYTLSLYAYRFNPSDPRLGYLDSEITNNTFGLSGHNVINSGPSFSTSSVSMNPRSSRYWEYNPAGQCDFVAFTFDGNGKDYGFSVMTVDGSNLVDRWTSHSDGWARTVRTDGLTRVVGVVTAVDESGPVDIGHGCVEPTINIKNPTSSMFEMIGQADDPRNFIVRVDVDGKDGSGVAGLSADAFTVEMEKAGGGATLTANVINATYVQDDYWLLVSPPTDSDGAESGAFYNLTVRLGSANDTENSSVLYVKRTQDVVIVLDRSGSMGGTTGKMEAAQDAAGLLVNELADDDQGAFVAFDTDADLREGLAPVGSGTGSHREDLEDAIDAETVQNLTSIGDGLLTAATEHDDDGNPDNMCSFVLLSDGYENEPEFWKDEPANQAEITDNGCAIHTIALGPEANELLMQEIAAAVPGGSYDYAEVSGNVPILGPVAADATDLRWELNLARVYDAKAVEISGRQRLHTYSSPGRDNQKEQRYQFYVDETSGLLVVSVAWRFHSEGLQDIMLIDPDGNPVDPSDSGVERRYSGLGTSEVWEVQDPLEGEWTLVIANLFQEYFVSATAISDYELYGFVGTPIDSLSQGVQVPIVATFVGPDKPVLGADVMATVRAPNGYTNTVKLTDDGNHGDGLADDGIYGGYYYTTAAADAPVPTDPVEGEEPAQVGSYQVNIVATWEKIRREVQTSFAVSQGADEDKDRLPDDWEKENNVDDPRGDDDGDKLINYCEFRSGTDPHNPDTDGGGQTDGSEVPQCEPDPNGQDPHDPTDDRVGPIVWFRAWPILYKLQPVIHVEWGTPLRGLLESVDIYRRTFDENGQLTQDWTQLQSDYPGDQLNDTDVEEGLQYQYKLVPMIQPEGGGPALPGAILDSNVAVSKSDPYAPGGSIVINNGDVSTDSLLVTLQLAADDTSSDDHTSGEPVPGTPVEDLEMRLSNRPDFAGAQWQPFQAEVTGWDLGDVQPNGVATVFVQFRDEAGNVSETGFALSDSIIYEANFLYLPIIFGPQ